MNTFSTASIGALVFAAAFSLNAPSRALALGDASTHFALYVPPNNSSPSRRVFLIVTAVSPESTQVDIVDDGADGDSDDSALGVTLARGESYIVRLADGAVNDDFGGKTDGDFFVIDADHPVVVQMATQSNWQHDWAPSEGKSGIGRSFFIYAPPTSGADNDINVYAYYDDTQLTISDVTVESTSSTGKTRIDLAAATLTLSASLDQGEDLIVRENSLGLDILDPGRTYWVQASRPVTVQYGHLGQVSGGNQARDGAGFVPSVNGSSTGSLYYFMIPHNPGMEKEKELRIACFDDQTTVTLYGANANDSGWTLIDSAEVGEGEHEDYVGTENAAFRELELYRLEVSPAHHRCTVFEGNWMETGSYGTSDFASAVSGAGGSNLDHVFTAYIGPPGLQDHVVQAPAGELTNLPSPSAGYASHLYIYALADATGVTVSDLDTRGTILRQTFSLDADGYYDLVVDSATYSALITGGRRPYLDVRADKPVMVMNGNFNDNWMAFFNSVRPPEPRVEVEVGADALSCGGTATVSIACANGTGPTLVHTQVTLTLPAGVSFIAGDDAPDSEAASQVRWDLGNTPAGTTHTLVGRVQLDCAAMGCAPETLAALTAECAGTGNGETFAALDSAQLTLVGARSTSVQEFYVNDVPDYTGNPPAPHTEVTFTLVGGTVGGTVRLLRATDPDADANQTVLQTWQPGRLGSPTPFTVVDPYALHYEQARFYRLEFEDGSGCTRRHGPVAVSTSSGGSGGEDSGLESNGRLAAHIARRAMARSGYGDWMLPQVRQTWIQKQNARGALEADLGAFLPTEGPGGSAPVNVSPADLPAITNAAAAFSVDYMGDDGQRVASALIVETVGEVYEHSKALCDRAGGSSIDVVENTPFPEGELLRMWLANERDATGEYAMELKLYEEANGQFEVHSAWLGSQYPTPGEGQRVLNLQVWSSRSGYDVSLAASILDALDLTWSSDGPAPLAFFQKVAALGGQVDLQLAGAQGAPEEVKLVAHVVDERGKLQTKALGPVHKPAWSQRLPLFQEATFELQDADGEVIDTVWVSDGAWSVVDDSMWGGHTAIDDLQVGECDPRATPVDDGDLGLAGCARLNARVESFAGVARHFGGALAPFDLSRFQAVRFKLKSGAPVHVCHTLEDESQSCTTVPATAGQMLTLPLSSFASPDTCEQGVLSAAKMITFAVHEKGRQVIEVSELTYLEAVPDDAHVPPDCGARVSSFGCSAGGSPSGRDPSWLFVFAALGLVEVRRRRPTKS